MAWKGSLHLCSEGRERYDTVCYYSFLGYLNSDLLGEYSSALSLPAVPMEGGRKARSAVSSTRLLFDVLGTVLSTEGLGADGLDAEGLGAGGIGAGGIGTGGYAWCMKAVPSLFNAFLLQNRCV